MRTLHWHHMPQGVGQGQSLGHKRDFDFLSLLPHQCGRQILISTLVSYLIIYSYLWISSFSNRLYWAWNLKIRSLFLTGNCFTRAVVYRSHRSGGKGSIQTEPVSAHRGTNNSHRQNWGAGQCYRSVTNFTVPISNNHIQWTLWVKLRFILEVIHIMTWHGYSLYTVTFYNKRHGFEPNFQVVQIIYLVCMCMEVHVIHISKFHWSYSLWHF